MKNKVKIIIPIALAAAAVICAAVVLCLFYFGVLHINNPSKSIYPVRGVDVSHYQGDVDWETLSKQGISFAFIKATEGSSYVDLTFEKNYVEANKTVLRVGAYHFFSF
ncbi:MAG: lysozyme, partial [Clostridia bacterium]|nr:lysozyme [Clostridia bacterium]